MGWVWGRPARVGVGASLARPHLKVGMSPHFWSARFQRGRASPGRSSCGRPRSVAAAVACLVLLAGCRLDLAAEAVVATDGGGTVAVVAGFDTELLDQLDALGVDPTAELEAAAASTAGWEAVRDLREDGGLEVVATRTVDEVAEIGDAFRELSAGLTDADPALLIDLEVTRDDEGGTAVTGRARLRPPSTPGVSLDGVEVGPDAEELAAIVADSVDAQLRIGLPGSVVDHDGDRLEGRTVIWDLPTGEAVNVRAEAEPPRWYAPLVGWWSELPATALVGLGALALLLGGGLLWRRTRTEASG